MRVEAPWPLTQSESQGSGRRQSHISTQAMAPIPAAAPQREGDSQISTTAHTAMAAAALRLARRLTRPPARQFKINGPKSGCLSSQPASLGELRAAAQAASSTKGVVGRPGRTTPATASTNATKASAIISQRAGPRRRRGASCCRGGEGGGLGSTGFSGPCARA